MYDVLLCAWCMLTDSLVLNVLRMFAEVSLEMCGICLMVPFVGTHLALMAFIFSAFSVLALLALCQRCL